ncbi:MAG TPA: DinB family protein [Dictyobacter sp.]|jgi:hypothetical protein|nr:DinB family protein [Dictyobacter sp.]
MAGNELYDTVCQKLITSRIEFVSQLARFRSEELVLQVVPSGWSPLQVAYHLSLIDGLALTQMCLIQEMDNPQLDNLADQASHLGQELPLPLSLDHVLTQMAARRKELFTYLEQLSLDAWQRSFHYAAWGVHTLYQLVMMLPLYDLQHTQQLTTLKAFMGR